MKRVYDRIPVASVISFISGNVAVKIIDRKPEGGEIVVYDGLIKDMYKYTAVYHGISGVKAMKAAVKEIIPAENAMTIRIDTRYEEF